MKSVLFWVFKVLGLVFFAGVIGYTAFLTYLVAQRLQPENMVAQIMTVILFDAAALVWFGLFITNAKSVGQWGVSLLGWVVGLTGAVIMAGGEIALGQNLVVLDDPEQLGWILVLANIIAALTHAVLSYLFHMFDPEQMADMEIGIQFAKMEKRAFDNSISEAERRVDEMTESLTDSMLARIEANIASKTTWYLRTENPQALPEVTGRRFVQPEIIHTKARRNGRKQYDPGGDYGRLEIDVDGDGDLDGIVMPADVETVNVEDPKPARQFYRTDTGRVTKAPPFA